MLVLLGTTLIVWVVAHEGAEVPGYVTIPHTASGNYLVGGPSNAGGLFRDWATRFLARRPIARSIPGAIPVWAPYPRGERVPLNDHTRRASLHRLDLTHDAAAIVRATDEASAFVVKRAVDAAVAHAGVQPKRVVASGGGTRVDAWVQAIADVTDLPVDCVAVPEGGALGSAWLARIAAGLEEPMAMTEGRRWAKVGRRVEPRDVWTAAVSRPLRGVPRPQLTGHSTAGSTHALAGEHEVRIARREPVAVGVAHAHPVPRDLGVGHVGARRARSLPRPAAAASTQRLSPADHDVAPTCGLVAARRRAHVARSCGASTGVDVRDGGAAVVGVRQGVDGAGAQARARTERCRRGAERDRRRARSAVTVAPAVAHHADAHARGHRRVPLAPLVHRARGSRAAPAAVGASTTEAATDTAQAASIVRRTAGSGGPSHRAHRGRHAARRRRRGRGAWTRAAIPRRAARPSAAARRRTVAGSPSRSQAPRSIDRHRQLGPASQHHQREHGGRLDQDGGDEPRAAPEGDHRLCTICPDRARSAVACDRAR